MPGVAANLAAAFSLLAGLGVGEVAAMAVPSVLVLDDEETLRFVLQSVVQSLGCNALVAGTKAQALEHLARRPLSVALLDLILPDGSGVEVLEEIKRASPDTEVIILTGHASLETAIASVRAGAYDYIEKPFELDALSALV